MKTKILSVLVFFTLGYTPSVFAQTGFDETVEVYNTSISVHSLNCVIAIGHEGVAVEERTSTQLPLSGHYLNKELDEAVEMNHRMASVMGCEVDILDRLKRKALRQSFGHVHSTVTVTKGVSKAARIVRGQCHKNYREVVTIDLGEDIVLKTTRKGKLISANGCK